MNLYQYIVRLADNSHILGHRLAEWCGHGPFLEQDMAMTNIALDLIGQARSLYNLAAEVQNEGKTEDDIAFLRYEYEYQNFLLVEQPNGDFAHTIVRQYFFSAYQLPYYKRLYENLLYKNERHLTELRGILEKAIKEINYHLRWSGEWMIRLGNGTEESHQKMVNAIGNLYKYTGELFIADETDDISFNSGFGVYLPDVKKEFLESLTFIMERSGLTLPENETMQTGGKQGIHTEYLGYILAEMQYMQRAYPDSKW
jgi:ring-1,2-phenylacetyl-CoA epoxidase subunit PaaC